MYNLPMKLVNRIAWFATIALKYTHHFIGKFVNLHLYFERKLSAIGAQTLKNGKKWKEKKIENMKMIEKKKSNQKNEKKKASFLI